MVVLSRRLAVSVFVLYSLALACPLSADVYVANYCGSVTVYAPTAVGDAAPVRTIAGAATGFNTPSGLTVDPVNSELYVGDFFGGAVRVFALGASGNVAPLRTFSGSNTGILQPRMAAVDTAHNEIFVPDILDSIRVFPRTPGGNVAPTRVISGSNTKIDNAVSIAFDPGADEIFVSSYNVGGPQVPGILVFNRTDSGNVAPKRIITGSNTQFGTFTNFLTLDLANGELFAQGNNGTGIVVFNLTDNGNVAPKRDLTGPATGMIKNGAIRVDAANNRVMTDNLGSVALFSAPTDLLVFSRTATGNTKPLMAVVGPATGLCGPLGIDLDSAGGLTGTIIDTTVPTAISQSVNVTINTAKSIALAAIDPDNVSFSFFTPTYPSNGSISNFNTVTGTLTYTPHANFVGADSFTFAATDGVNVSAPATVSITVTQAGSSLPDLIVGGAILGNPATVSPGEEFSYALVVTNQGSDMPTGSTTKVLDQLPSKVTFLSWEEGARGKMPFYLGVTCSFNAPALTCVGPPLVQDDWYVVRIIVKVNDDANGGNLVNLAFADPLGEVVESSENNNMLKIKTKIQ